MVPPILPPRDPSDDAPAHLQPSGVELAPGVFVDPTRLRVQFSRSGGPGGQNVNKLNTKAELWVHVESIVGITRRARERLRALAGTARMTADDQIHIRAEAERSQEANRAEAFERLRQLIVAARIEPKVRRKTKPSKSAKRRRLESKRRRGQTKSGRQGPRANGEDW